MAGDDREVLTCELILRPVKDGMCRISECKAELSLPELWQLNLALDERNDTKGPGITDYL